MNSQNLMFQALNSYNISLPTKLALYLLKETGMRPKSVYEISRKNLMSYSRTLQFTEVKTHVVREVMLTPRTLALFLEFLKRKKSFKQIWLTWVKMRNALIKHTPRINLKGKHNQVLYIYRYFYIYNRFLSGSSPEDIRLDLGHHDLTYTMNYINVVKRTFE